MIRVIDKSYRPIGLLSNDAPNGITYYDDQLKTTIASGLYTLEFKVDKKNSNQQILKVGNMLETYNRHKKQLLMTITNIVENRYEKTIFAEDANITMLNGYAPALAKPGSPERLSYYAGGILENSGYKILVNESDTTKVVDFTSGGRRLELIRTLAKEFDVELEFGVDFQVGSPPHFFANFLKSRVEGEFHFKVSSEDLLGEIEKTIDYYNVITKLNVRGKQKNKPTTASLNATATSAAPVPQKDTLIEKVIEIAMAQRGKPYVWGSNGPTTFDCSGFINYSFKKGGYTNWPAYRCITNNYWNQDPPFYRVSTSDRQRGDLVLMDTGYTFPGDANHVGLYLGNGQMVHAGDPVQVSNVSNFTVLGYVRVKKP